MPRAELISAIRDCASTIINFILAFVGRVTATFITVKCQYTIAEMIYLLGNRWKWLYKSFIVLSIYFTVLELIYIEI